MFMISQLIRLDVDNVHNLISSTIANFRNKATFPRRQHARCVRLYGNYDEFCLNGGGGFDQFLKAEVGEKSKSIRQCFTLHTGQKIPAAPPNPSSQANTNGLASMSDRAMAFKLLFNRIPVLFRFFPCRFPTESFNFSAFSSSHFQANWPIGIHWPIGSSLLYHSTHRLVRDKNACLAFLSRTSLMLRSEATLRCCSTASRYRDAAPCSGIRKIPVALPNPSSQANTNGLASVSDRAMAFKLLFNRIPVLFRFFPCRFPTESASIGRSGRPCCITQLTGWFGTRMPVWHSCPEPA